jgi:hypothetical protein
MKSAESVENLKISRFYKVLGGDFGDGKRSQLDMGMALNVSVVLVSVPMSGAMRAACAARLGASAQSFVHDLLDGPGTAATLCTATKASIDLPRRTRRMRSGNGIADIVVGEDVAGTDNHEMKARSQVRTSLGYAGAPANAKGKHAF